MSKFQMLDLMLQGMGGPSLMDVLDMTMRDYREAHPFTPARTVHDSQFGWVSMG